VFLSDMWRACKPNNQRVTNGLIGTV